MPGPKPTDEELAMLTDEERNALEDETILDEGDVDPVSGVEAVIPDDQNALKTGPDALVTAAEPAPAADANPAPAPAPAADPAASPAPAAPAAPVAPAKPSRDFAAEINGIQSEQAALAKKFDEGDLSAEEYEAQRQPLADKLFDVKFDERQSLKQAEATAETFFTVDVPAFMAAHPAYAEGTARYAAMNDRVVRLQNEAIEKTGNPNAQYDKNLLQRAFEAIEKELGPTQHNAPAITERVLPPSLKDAPSSSTDDDITNNSRWAALDRLAETDPEKYEAELARLPEADQQAYLQAS